MSSYWSQIVTVFLRLLFQGSERHEYEGYEFINIRHAQGVQKSYVMILIHNRCVFFV